METVRVTPGSNEEGSRRVWPYAEAIHQGWGWVRSNPPRGTLRTEAIAEASRLVESSLSSERRLLNLQKKLARLKLLIVDELGFVPLSKTGAELLFDRYFPYWQSSGSRGSPNEMVASSSGTARPVNGRSI